MGDTYREILVKKQAAPTQKLLRILIIALDVLLILAGVLVMPLLILAGGVMCIVSYMFLLPMLDIEYEYLYVNGALDIDAIYAKQKRKKVCSCEIDELEILAPSNSHVLDSYLAGGKAKVTDYTSGTDAASYTLVFLKEKEKEIIKVELDEEIVADLRRRAPRKVNLY